MTQPLKLDLPADRNERLQYMRRSFPNAVGVALTDNWRGGRHEAIKRVNSFDVGAYSRNRNFINGSVSKLSPYIRYGCITPKEIADILQEKFGNASQGFIMQVAWRDYWRRVWYEFGDDIYSNIEEAKVPLGDNLMPDYIRQGITGLPCMDGFIRNLMQEGYVHNHARLWFAAYVVHWLKVDWRDAAEWFESYLLDGDIASNHLSWQWVASTFSSKPYYFNKENLARFTGGKYCATCKINCPFDETYDLLRKKLFTLAPPKRLEPVKNLGIPKSQFSGENAVAIYIHDEMLSATHPLASQSIPSIFVFDKNVHAKWPLKRLQFVADCLSELPNIEIWMGDTVEILKARGIGKLITQDTPNLQIKRLLSPFKTNFEPETKLFEAEISSKRLKRFSRYWEKSGRELFGEDVAPMSRASHRSKVD